MSDTVTDKRRQGWFSLDNQEFDTIAPAMGPIGMCVYLALVRCAKNDECFPSHKFIASKIGASASSVKRALNALREAGYITWDVQTTDQGGQTSNLYTILGVPQGTPPGDTLTSPPSVSLTPGAVHIDIPPPVSVTHHINNTKFEQDSEEQIPLSPPQGGDCGISNEAVPRSADDPSFNDFWASYPNKQGKPAARRAWDKATRDSSPAAIMDGLGKWLRSAKWLRDHGRYIPHPSTFLNQRRWEDYPATIPPPEPPPGEAIDHAEARYIPPDDAAPGPDLLYLLTGIETQPPAIPVKSRLAPQDRTREEYSFDE